MHIHNLSVVRFIAPPDNGVNGFRGFCTMNGITSGRSYIMLGFIGMQDTIVLVNDHGLVVQIPYSKECFIET